MISQIADNIKMAEYSNKSTILININIPDKNVERNIEWSLNETVASLKQFVLKTVPGLEDPLNYGFFLPPFNGKNGKFLQEERSLDHYASEDSFKLELKKKIRMYHLSTNSLKHKKINNKSNQKQFIQFIRNNDVMKINKILYDGIDPNFQIPGIPETPLSLACKLKDPHVVIMALANNGAFLDFRSSDSLTALHKTAIEGLFEPMKTLLQLGQSPNCKDNRGYTPLYYCIENDAPGDCVELLLFEHSMLGACDEHGLQEIHKASLYGRTNHLDHLISYGADIDAKTNKGNTALHVCALHNQGACARLLLYRGITRHALNDESKSAYQTALLSNNLELADLIQNFRDDDVVPVTTLPKFNEKRRSIVPSIKRFSSYGRVSNDTDIFNQDNQSISSDEKNSLYGSIKSLPQRINSSPYTPQEVHKLNVRNSESFDSQSLQNFPKSKSKDNNTHLNTWNSSGDNEKLNIKTRFPIASIINSKTENIPRVVVLQKSPVGFGFIIRGNKNDHDVDFIAKPSMPATHYFEGIAENSPSQHAGLCTGDFLLEVNNVDVHKMPHDEVVRIIHMAGDNLTMKVITVNPSSASNGLFDGCSDEKSCSDSMSQMSDNNSSLNASQSNIVVEATTGTKEFLKVSSVKSNQVPKQNMSPLIPTESRDDDFFKSKLKTNNQNNKRNINIQDNVKVIKSPAPPPPMRADNTLLTISQSSEDNSCKYSNENDKKSDYMTSDSSVIDNDYSSSNQSINKSIINKLNSSKLYIPPPDYNTDTDDDRSVSMKVSLSGTFVPPAPPLPPPPPPPSINSAKGSPSLHLNNLDQAIAAVSLKPVSHNDKDVNDEMSIPLNSHDKALRDAILNYRKKVECGETITDNIEDKLKESKVGKKSIVFEANSTLVNNNSDLPKSASIPHISTLDSNNKTNLLVATKNPPVKPKPGQQNFFAAKPQSPSIDNEKLNESNLRLKAEKLRTDLMKKEQETSKGTLYFTSSK